MHTTTTFLYRYVPLGVVGTAGVIAMWHSSMLPVALTMLATVLVVSGGRALRCASARVDRILREEHGMELDRDMA